MKGVSLAGEKVFSSYSLNDNNSSVMSFQLQMTSSVGCRMGLSLVDVRPIDYHYFLNMEQTPPNCTHLKRYSAGNLNLL